MVCHAAAGCSVIATVTATRQHLPSGTINLQLSFQAGGCYLEQREDAHRDVSIGCFHLRKGVKLSALKGKGCHVCVPPGWDSVDFLQEHQCMFHTVRWVYLLVLVTNTCAEIPSGSQPYTVPSGCPWAGPRLVYRQWNLEKWMDFTAWIRAHCLILSS